MSSAHLVPSHVLAAVLFLAACGGDAPPSVQETVIEAADCAPSVEGFRFSPTGDIGARPAFDSAQVVAEGVYFGVIYIAPGATIPPHVHDTATETLIVTCGSATGTLDGTAWAVETDGIMSFPRGHEHGAVAGPRGLVASQVYAPGDDGLRFYGWTPR
jgi:quercetin dioxygenase-like cupin family protein